jgi:hypothetical protein
MKDKLICNVKFNNLLSIFYNKLKKEISNDIIYSHTFWNENDMLTQNISTIKDNIVNSVIQNKYKKVYKI